MKRTFLNLIFALAFGIALFRGTPAQATVTNAANAVSYTCLNTDPTTYTVTFPYLATSDLTVTSTTAGGAVTPLALTTDWTAPTSTTSTATLTLAARARCPTGSTLKISRVVAYKQPQSFRTQGTYDPNALERAIDRLEMQIQQIASGPYTSGANLTTLGGMSVLNYGLQAPASNPLLFTGDAALGFGGIHLNATGGGGGDPIVGFYSEGTYVGAVSAASVGAGTLLYLDPSSAMQVGYSGGTLLMQDATTPAGGVTSFQMQSVAVKSTGFLLDVRNSTTSKFSIDYKGSLISGNITATAVAGSGSTAVVGTGDSGGAGGSFTGGASAPYGVEVIGGGTNGGGVRGTGAGNGYGGYFAGGSSGAGVVAVAGGGAASGVSGTGASFGGGGIFTGGPSGPGVYAIAGGGNSPVTGTVNLSPTSNAPSAPINGDLWVTTGTAPPVFGVKAGGTSYNLLGGMIEHNLNAYNAANIAAGTPFAQGYVTAASTLTYSSMVHNIAGAGTGTFVAKLCSDGATCGAGNVYLTCTVGANCATAAAGRIDSCTITKAAVPAATTLTWSVTTACGTTNPGINFAAHLTTP